MSDGASSLKYRKGIIDDLLSITEKNGEGIDLVILARERGYVSSQQEDIIALKNLFEFQPKYINIVLKGLSNNEINICHNYSQ